MCQDGIASPEPVRISIVQHFEDLPDPRAGPNAVHKLIDIIVIAACAVIAGCEACTQMAEYGRRKESWLRKFLELPRGIPSHDTFSRVLALKKNQNSLYEDVAVHFEQLQTQPSSAPPCNVYETHEKGHGREEHRTAYALPVPENLGQREL